MIETRGLSKAYGATPVLDRIDLQVDRGEVLLLLGCNGSGKSTMFRCILGLEAYAGQIRVDGLDPLRDGKEVRSRVGYMPQSDGLHSDLTVAETLAFYAALRGVDDASAGSLLAEVRLVEAAGSRVDEISGGMRQRLAFAVALLGDPPVLLLDEPTASLDGWSREVLVERVRELAGRGKAVLLATHAEHRPLREIGRARFLRDGRLVAAEAAVGFTTDRQALAPGLLGGSGDLGWVLDSRGNPAEASR